MGAKSVHLAGLGTIMISPISVKEKDYETVDPSGKPVVKKIEGSVRGKTTYVNSEGVVIPSTQLCKKIVVEDEEMVLPKFKPTKEIAADNLTVVEDNSIVYRALDRKFYNVVTDHEKLKELVMEQNKTVVFPFTAGNGWKVWQAVLTNWQKKMILVCCRGDLAKELQKYAEDTVEIELEIIPQQKNMKKLVKAMAMI